MSDFAVKLDEARARLPLRRLMEQYGKGPPNGNWKTFPVCPYCGHKGCAGLFGGKGGGELFKCHHADCPTGTQVAKGAWDEIGFLAYELHLQRREAAVTYLKEAGVWQEQERLAPSVMPGQRGRKRAVPQPPPETFPPTPAAQTEPESEVTRQAPEPPEVLSNLPRTESPIATDASPAMPGSAAPPEPTSGAAGPSANIPWDQPSRGESFVAGATLAVPGAPPDAVGASVPSAGELTGRPGGAALSGSHEPGPPGATTAAANGPDGAPPDGLSPPPPPPINGEGAADASGAPALQALRWFYKRLHLTEGDRLALWTRRGLTAATCAALGYRSNLQGNQEILRAMAAEFSPPVLLDSGLWSEGRKPGDPAAPNPQFYGMSLREKRGPDGKKVKDPDGKEILESVWDHPILIPYFDGTGQLVHLRPHKGMMRDKPPHFYAAQPGREWLETQPPRDPELPRSPASFAVVTEGEFKAAALWQVLGPHSAGAQSGLPSAAIGSLPGVSMAKPLFSDVLEWLDDLGLRQIVVAYDNEEKGDPKLPGFKEEEEHRFDSQIWARYLARKVSQEGYDGKVCILPKTWRDANGKADWDGALAVQIAAAAERVGIHPVQGVLPPEAWDKAGSRVRAEWMAVLHKAMPSHELWQGNFFDEREERLIKSGLERISYEPRLPVGSYHEAGVSRRLKRLVGKLKAGREWVRDELPAARGVLMQLAKRYEDLRGGYYIFKRLSERSQGDWQRLLGQAADNADIEVKRACEIVLLGWPERITDFFMKPHYALRKTNGTMSRMVTIHNIHGVNTGFIELPARAFARPSDFREWLLNVTTGATWMAGEREMNALQMDFSRAVSFKDVEAVPLRGYHAASRLWFFRDVVFDPDGYELREDKKGIIWFGGQAYKLMERDHENQSLRHGEPRMRPVVKASTFAKSWRELAAMPAAEMEPSFVDDKERMAIRTLFQLVSRRLYETIGGYGGYLALGMVLSFAAGPEVFNDFAGQPSLWIHGETKQGKTSVARWLMQVWGLSVQNGIALLPSSQPGMSIALQQYGSLPVWFEEFQPSAPVWMIEKLKNMFDRTSGSKKTLDERDREIVGPCIVTGVATSQDAQLRSRFAHVQVAASNRMANHFEWFQRESPRFFLLGRFVLQHRKAFARGVLERTRGWLDSLSMTGVDPRARLVHGVAFSAFMTLVEMLESHLPEDMAAYRKFTMNHCVAAVHEVDEQINVNQFWRELLDALASDAFGETVGDRLRCFKVVENAAATSPVSPYQLQLGAQTSWLRWKSYLLYFRPGPVIDMLRQYKRRQGRDLPLEQSDLRAQMRTRSYWIAAKGDVHRQRFGEGSRTPHGCWCIDVDKHELGYQAMEDVDFERTLYVDGKVGDVAIRSDEWVDPRRGDLFGLIDALQRLKQEEIPA